MRQILDRQIYNWIKYTNGNWPLSSPFHSRTRFSLAHDAAFSPGRYFDDENNNYETCLHRFANAKRVDRQPFYCHFYHQRVMIRYCHAKPIDASIYNITIPSHTLIYNIIDCFFLFLFGLRLGFPKIERNIYWPVRAVSYNWRVTFPKYLYAIPMPMLRHNYYYFDSERARESVCAYVWVCSSGVGPFSFTYSSSTHLFDYVRIWWRFGSQQLNSWTKFYVLFSLVARCAPAMLAHTPEKTRVEKKMNERTNDTIWNIHHQTSSLCEALAYNGRMWKARHIVRAREYHTIHVTVAHALTFSTEALWLFRCKTIVDIDVAPVLVTGDIGGACRTKAWADQKGKKLGLRCCSNRAQPAKIELGNLLRTLFIGFEAPKLKCAASFFPF